MKSPLRLWIISAGVSAGSHAAVLAAIAIGVAGQHQSLPRIELPVGEALSVQVMLVSAELEATSEANPQSQQYEAEVELLQSIGLAEQETESEIDQQSDSNDVMVVEADWPLTPQPTAEIEMTSINDETTSLIEAELEIESHELVELLGVSRARLAQGAQAVRAMMYQVTVKIESASRKLSVLSQLPLDFAKPQAAMAPSVAGGAAGVIHGPSPSNSNKPPKYPEEARRQRQSGIVILHLSIASSGRVSGSTIIKSSGFALLDQAATSAATSWRFAPATEDGAAIDCEVDLPVEFVLR